MRGPLIPTKMSTPSHVPRNADLILLDGEGW